MLWAWCILAVAAAALGCELTPPNGTTTAPKSPGDNFYKVFINGGVEWYKPGHRYSVTLAGMRTHQKVQKFTRFKIILVPAGRREKNRQGEFQLFADTLTKFDEECSNTVVETDDLPKTEVHVMWKAPPTGHGCLEIRAMVMENSTHWYAEDGQLTFRICEDTSGKVSECCACDDAKYKMVFEGLWSPKTHPKDFPTQTLWLTHFSDVIGTTHTKQQTFWGEGQIATDGFRSLAEWGSPGALELELRQQTGQFRSIFKAPGLWHPKVNSNTSAAFTVDRNRHQLTLASMFGPSPDWFVGVTGLELCQKDCSWVEKKTVDLFPYDAGTDNGISYLSPNSETTPRERMYAITPMYPEDPRAPFYNPGGSIAPLARLYLTREKIIPRPCEDDVLQALVVDEAENEEMASRPECAVSKWGAWLPCSVTCGKGLRLRTREYLQADKAQAAGCDRPLISREMCVAGLAECPANPKAARTLDIDEDLLSVEGINETVCGTTEWGPWSECSVTCGVGVSTRRRQFINHMGYKKCTLVATEENRKCMQPACTEQETEISDPACPTTAWAGWSPCSATCGRGVRFRTRLLLVPADRQQECSGKVELLQQRPCQEREDCTIDMATAKQICMEPPEQGPCRGLYQRWAFAAAKGMCVPFSYGGCRGNRNNFISSEDCLSTCSVLTNGGAPPANARVQFQGVGQQAPSVSSNYPGLSVSAIIPITNNSLSGSDTVDCQISEWGPWSHCSVTCGTGFQERTRTILVPPGPGGAPCPTRMSRRRRCMRHC